MEFTAEPASPICEVRVTPLSMPVRQPYVWALGVAEHVIADLVEIEDAEGRCGIGECTTAPTPTRSPRSCGVSARRPDAPRTTSSAACTASRSATSTFCRARRSTSSSPTRGELALPPAPGLGLELDRDAVQAAGERFEQR